MISPAKLANFSNPKDLGNQKIGIKIGVIKPKNLLAEDALVSNQPLNYTLKAETSLVVWFIPAK